MALGSVLHSTPLPPSQPQLSLPSRLATVTTKGPHFSPRVLEISVGSPVSSGLSVNTPPKTSLAELKSGFSPQGSLGTLCGQKKESPTSEMLIC